MAFTPRRELSRGCSSGPARESLSCEASVWTSRPHQSARRIGDDVLSPFRSCRQEPQLRPLIGFQSKALTASRFFRRSACIPQASLSCYRQGETVPLHALPFPTVGAVSPTYLDFHETSVTAFHGRNQEQQADGSARVGSFLCPPQQFGRSDSFR